MQIQRPGSAPSKRQINSVYRVYGLFYDPQFYLIELLVRKLYDEYSNLTSKFQFEFYKLNQTQYDYYLKIMKSNFPDRGILAHSKGSPIITYNYHQYIANIGKIVELFSKPLNPGQMYRPPEIIGNPEILQSENICREQTIRFFNRPNYVYFQINASSRSQMRVPSQFKIVIQLFNDVTPKSCHKFLELCQANDGYGQSSFSRLCKNYFIQGGKIKRKLNFFEDEIKNYIKHDKPGIVGLTNLGYQHSNDVQFYISLNKIPGFDGKTVVIGQVILGMKHLRKINKVQNSFSQKPVYDLKIGESGIYQYDPVDFQSTKNPIRVSTAPFKETKETQQIKRGQEMVSKQQKSVISKTHNDNIQIEQNIIECSKFLFELSDSDNEHPVDLLYSQSRASFFNQFSKQYSKQEPDYVEFMPHLSESLSECEPRLHESRQSNRSYNQQVQLVESFEVKVSLVNGI